MIELCESFLSIQGESTHAGRLCYFLRLTGCNLTCTWCDAKYALESSGNLFTVDELADKAAASGVDLVEITGGEPLLQKDTPALAEALQKRGMTVMVETNGSVSIAPLPSGVIRIVDCKPPSSGMAEYNDFSNYPLMTGIDELKFPIADRDDFDYMCRVIAAEHPEHYAGTLLCSPVSPLEPAQLAEWLLEAKIPKLRMQLQMHKVIWGKDTKL